jgi:hypothetical protein
MCDVRFDSGVEAVARSGAFIVHADGAFPAFSRGQARLGLQLIRPAATAIHPSMTYTPP